MRIIGLTTASCRNCFGRSWGTRTRKLATPGRPAGYSKVAKILFARERQIGGGLPEAMRKKVRERALGDAGNGWRTIE